MAKVVEANVARGSIQQLAGARRRRGTAVLIAIAAAAGCGAIGHRVAEAASTWTQAASGTSLWSAPANWDVNGVPVSDVATVVNFFADNTTVLPLSPGITASQDLSPNPFVLNQLNLNGTSTGGTGLLTISGNAIQFDGTAPSLNFNAAYGAGSGTTYTISSGLVFNTGTAINYNSNGGVLNITGQLSGAGNISYTGPTFRNLTLNTTSADYTGNVTVNTGTVAIRTANTLGSTTSNTVTIASGARVVFGNFSAGNVGTMNKNWVVSGNGDGRGALQLMENPYDYFNNSNGVKVAGSITLAADTKFGGTTSTNSPSGYTSPSGDLLQITGLVSGAFAVSNGGSTSGGSPVLSNVVVQLENPANSFSGGVNVFPGGALGFKFSAAVPVAATGNSIFGTGALTLRGGKLLYNGGNYEFYQDPNNFQHTITVGAEGGTFDTNSGTQVYGKFVFDGAGALTKVGSRNLLLGANSPTYSGNVAINGGGIQLWSNNIGTGAVTVAAGAHLDLGGYNAGTVGNFSQNVTLNGDGGGVGALGLAQDPFDYANNTAPVTVSGTVTLASDSAIGGTTTSDHGGVGVSMKVTGVISGNFALTKVGNTNLQLTAVNTYSGNTNVNAGRLILNAGGAIASNIITVASVASMTINGDLAATATVNANGATSFGGSTGVTVLNRPLAALNVGTGQTALVTASSFAFTPAVLHPTSLTFADATAKIDLTNNELITTTTLSSAVGKILSGQIFTSSTGGVLGSLDIGGGEVEVRFTLPGDTNLDGKVDVGDLGNLATAYGATSGAVWAQGDSNYDGAVDVGDLGSLATSYGNQLAAGPSAGGTGGLIASPLASVAGGAAAVPEPTMLGLIGLGAAALMGRRRRR